jgi:hypothetical protein
MPVPGEPGLFCGKSGVVLACGGAPVKAGAAGRCGFGGSWPEGGREMVGIGLVTAAAQAGGTPGLGVAGTGVGSKRGAPSIGSVVAADTFGRGVILVEAGFNGLGGRLMRRVSRLGELGSEPSGRSAMISLFIVISGKVQSRNS